ncbi:MAG: ATP-binding cassette domain-containing protein [Alphaproteobacteria bacterium]|nr:ATP-binding cassette domain-containing protein [Alphaproteobacteria bacterium]
MTSSVAENETGAILSLTHVDLNLKSDAGDVHILKDISLSLPAARSVGIMGPSGSGKTTLLMVLGGLEKPTTGHVAVAGQDFSGLDEDALASFRRDNIGIIFQNFHLIPTMTALENVAVPLELAGEKRAFEKAKEALDAVGLSHRTTHYPGQLSGGEQQRVAIARAFAPAPRLILADEPTGNLDAETGAQVTKTMFDLAKSRGATLVMVTHDAALAGQCDSIVHIRDGKIETPA